MNGAEDLIGIKISPQQAADFINKLATSAEFREDLQRDPTRKLADYGITIPRALLPEQVQLPSHEEVKRALEEVDPGEFAQFGGDWENKFWPFFWLFVFFKKFSPPPPVPPLPPPEQSASGS